MNESQIRQTLRGLVKLCKASEKGFNVAAGNVKNRGLKILLKNFAQQRAQFAQALQTELETLGGEKSRRSGPVAGIHRGWINIKSAMTIGQASTEQVVLAECLRGERIIMRNYERVTNRPLPAHLNKLVADQYSAIQQTCAEVTCLSGLDGTRMVVRLFDRAVDIERTMAALNAAGIERKAIKQVDLSQIAQVYTDKGRTGIESLFAGAFLGALAGVLFALIAGLGSTLLTGEPFATSLGVSLAPTILLTALIGALFGGSAGAIIGIGVRQEDEHNYAKSLADGVALLMVETGVAQANEASIIMREINAQRWAVAN